MKFQAYKISLAALSSGAFLSIRWDEIIWILYSCFKHLIHFFSVCKVDCQVPHNCFDFWCLPTLFQEHLLQQGSSYAISSHWFILNSANQNR